MVESGVESYIKGIIMPFKSDKQRKWMHTNEPEMAKSWEDKKKREGDWAEKELQDEAKKRDYKDEYKKFQSSDKSKKYRAELNKYNRKKGTYGNGDGKDASHKGGKIAGFEKESVNRGRAEKSRLKKEEKLTELTKFTPVQVKQLQKAFKNAKGILPDTNPVMIKLNKMLMSVDKKNLEMIANAGINILSPIAKKRLGMKEGKLNEAKETIFDVATRVVKNHQAEKWKGQMMDATSANLLVKVFKKVNPKMKQILT